MTFIRDILSASPVMPVIVLDRVDDAVPLAEALVSGGIRVLEVTMRTSAALDCVRAIRAAVPHAIVGVGTITNIADMDAAREAGAAFGVSPGTTPELLGHAAATGFPFLPGSMTPSDVMRAVPREAGRRHRNAQSSRRAVSASNVLPDRRHRCRIGTRFSRAAECGVRRRIVVVARRADRKQRLERDSPPRTGGCTPC
jgi:DNA-binding NarL/FixJ family response regulator